MPIFFRHAQNSFSWETAVLRDTRAQLANVYIEVHSCSLDQANYSKIATKGRADGTKKSSRKSVFPVKSTVSKEEERNYQCRYKQCPSGTEKNC